MGTDALSSSLQIVVSESALLILRWSAVSSFLRMECFRSSSSTSCSTELIRLFEQLPSQFHRLRQPSRTANTRTRCVFKILPVGKFAMD